jgi:DNA mismatch endonuclease (patch repair protein)
VAIFVDGCFWHGCPEHGTQRFQGPNASRWVAKMARNKANDRRGTAAAEALGWRVVRLWECQVIARVSSLCDDFLDGNVVPSGRKSQRP